MVRADSPYQHFRQLTGKRIGRSQPLWPSIFVLEENAGGKKA